MCTSQLWEARIQELTGLAAEANASAQPLVGTIYYSYYIP